MGEKDVRKRKSFIMKEKEGEKIDGSAESTNERLCMFSWKFVEMMLSAFSH
jgi:hypothetical protein